LLKALSHCLQGNTRSKFSACTSTPHTHMVSKNSISTTSVTVLTLGLFAAHTYFPGSSTESTAPASEISSMPEIVFPKEDGLAGLERLESESSLSDAPILLGITKSGGFALADHSYGAMVKRSSTAPKKPSPVSDVSKKSLALQKGSLPKQSNDVSQHEELLAISISFTIQKFFSLPAGQLAIVLTLFMALASSVFLSDIQEEQKKAVEEDANAACFDMTLDDDDDDEVEEDDDDEDEWWGKDSARTAQDYEDDWWGKDNAPGQEEENCVEDHSQDSPLERTSKVAQKCSSTALPLWVPALVVVNIAIQIFRLSAQL